MSDYTKTPSEIELNQWCKKRWTTSTRYYVAEIKQDLFGAWLLERSWGGLRNHRGSQKSTLINDYDQALSLLQNIEKRRKARGYS